MNPSPSSGIFCWKKCEVATNILYNNLTLLLVGFSVFKDWVGDSNSGACRELVFELSFYRFLRFFFTMIFWGESVGGKRGMSGFLGEYLF